VSDKRKYCKLHKPNTCNNESLKYIACIVGRVRVRSLASQHSLSNQASDEWNGALAVTYREWPSEPSRWLLRDCSRHLANRLVGRSVKWWSDRPTSNKETLKSDDDVQHAIKTVQFVGPVGCRDRSDESNRRQCSSSVLSVAVTGQMSLTEDGIDRRLSTRLNLRLKSSATWTSPPSTMSCMLYYRWNVERSRRIRKIDNDERDRTRRRRHSNVHVF